MGRKSLKHQKPKRTRLHWKKLMSYYLKVALCPMIPAFILINLIVASLLNSNHSDSCKAVEYGNPWVDVKKNLEICKKVLSDQSMPLKNYGINFYAKVRSIDGIIIYFSTFIPKIRVVAENINSDYLYLDAKGGSHLFVHEQRDVPSVHLDRNFYRMIKEENESNPLELTRREFIRSYLNLEKNLNLAKNISVSKIGWNDLEGFSVDVNSDKIKVRLGHPPFEKKIERLNALLLQAEGEQRYLKSIDLDFDQKAIVQYE